MSRMSGLRFRSKGWHAKGMRANTVNGPIALLRWGLGGLLALASVLYAGSALATQRFERSVLVDGERRSYVLHLPDDLSAKRRWPVIVAYHPALSSDVGMERMTLLHAVAAKEFITAYPDGFRVTFNAGDCCGAAKRRNIDDVAFFEAILADIETVVQIESKAYVTGYSNGARMAYHLICVLPERVAAAAPFGATRNMTDCNPARVPLFHIHGLADKNSPVEGGYPPTAYLRRNLGYMEPAEKVVGQVAARNGCNAQTEPIEVRDLKTTCQRHMSCGQAETIMCLVSGLGHIWPGHDSRSQFFGPARTDVDGSRAVVRFFLQH